MAINRIWQSGLESGNINEFDYSNISVGTTDPKTGTYDIETLSNSHVTDIRQGIPSTRKARGGKYLRTGIGSNGANKYLFRIYSSGVSGTLHVAVRILPSSTDLVLEILGSQEDNTSIPIPVDTLYHIAWDINIDSSIGWAYIYVNGSLVMSFDGNTGNADIDTIRIGPASGDSSNSIGALIIDDMYLDDTTGEASPTAPPIKRFYPLNVNGDGNYSQWTPSTGTSHYELVDERPPDDDATYLEAVTGSLLDSFTMTTFTLDTNEDIIAMIPFVFAKRGSTTEKISLGTRSSGTNLIGTDQDLSTSYDYIWERQITGSLGSPWNQSYMDSVEVIINSTGTY